MLAQRRIRWANIETALGQRPVFAECSQLSVTVSNQSIDVADQRHRREGSSSKYH